MPTSPILLYTSLISYLLDLACSFLSRLKRPKPNFWNHANTTITPLWRGHTSAYQRHQNHPWSSQVQNYMIVVCALEDNFAEMEFLKEELSKVRISTHSDKPLSYFMYCWHRYPLPLCRLPKRCMSGTVLWMRMILELVEEEENRTRISCWRHPNRRRRAPLL